MSGGHYDYKCYRVMELCDEMEHQLYKYKNPGVDDYQKALTSE